MSSKYDSKQLSMLNKLNEDKPKPSLSNDPCVKMETKLPGDKIQLILELTLKDKDKIFNALGVQSKGGSSAITGNKRKSDESSSATNFFLQAKESKQKQNDADVEKRKADLKAKADLAMKENKKKQERKKELEKIQGDDNFEHFKAHYEQDDSEFNTKKAVDDESYFTELKECYDNWKEHIEPQLMEEAAGEEEEEEVEEDKNNLSTWSQDKQMDYLQKIDAIEDADDQLEFLHNDDAIVNSKLAIEHFAAWLATGSKRTTDNERNPKPFPGISEINGEEFDPDTFTMTTYLLPLWFSFAQNVYPEDDDVKLTYNKD